MEIEEIRERYLFHDRSFKASGIEPDQEHHDIGALLTALAEARKELEEQAWSGNTGPVPKDGKQYLTYCKLMGWQLTEWMKYKAVHLDDDREIKGYTSDCMTPTVWDGKSPDMWWPLPKPPKNEVV